MLKRMFTSLLLAVLSLVLVLPVTALADYSFSFLPRREYQGTIYEARPSAEITTVLLIGYDHQSFGTVKELHGYSNGGQSDFILLLVAKNQISVPQTSTSREYIRPGKDVFCELNVDESGYYEVQLSSTYQFKYEIYDEDFDIVISGTGTRYNTILSLVAGKYYLRANFTTNTTLFPVSVLITEHGHSYQYSIINTTGSGVGGNLYYHQKTCTECSYTAQESHAWQANTTQSGTTYTCTKCTLVTTTPPAIQDGSGEDEVMALIDNADTAESPCDCSHSHETNSPDGD